MLHDVLPDLAAEVGRQARAEGLAGRTVTLKIRFAGFETHTRRRTLEASTNHDNAIFRAALELARERSFRDRSVRLLGVGLSEWSATGTAQPDRFATAGDGEKDNCRYAALKEIQRRWGKPGLRVGMPPKGRVAPLRRDSKLPAGAPAGSLAATGP